MSQRRESTTPDEETRLVAGLSKPLLAVRVHYGEGVDYLPLARILAGTQLALVRTEECEGRLTDVLSFSHEDASSDRNSLQARMAQSLDGLIWIDPESEGVVRIEFNNRTPIRIAGGLFGKVSRIQGYLRFQRLPGDLWIPHHAEVNVEGHEVIVSVIALRFSKAYHLSEVTDYTAYSEGAKWE